MAASDDSFIREVNEALQQDRLGLLWRRYGALAIALAVGVVLATAGFVAWEAWKERRLQDQGAAFAEADALLQAKKPKEAADAYATVVADGGGGSADLARLLRADALFEAKDGAAADGALEGLAGEAGADPILRVGDLTLNEDSHEVERSGTEIELTAKEFSVLEFLARNAATVVSKQEILAHVWDYDFEGDPNIVEVYVRHLRKKVDEPFGRSSIQTARGAGYRLSVERA